MKRKLHQRGQYEQNVTRLQVFVTKNIALFLKKKEWLHPSRYLQKYIYRYYRKIYLDTSEKNVSLPPKKCCVSIPLTYIYIYIYISIPQKNISRYLGTLDKHTSMSKCLDSNHQEYYSWVVFEPSSIIIMNSSLNTWKLPSESLFWAVLTNFNRFMSMSHK